MKHKMLGQLAHRMRAMVASSPCPQAGRCPCEALEPEPSANCLLREDACSAACSQQAADLHEGEVPAELLGSDGLVYFRKAETHRGAVGVVGSGTMGYQAATLPSQE
jgi:hypothetical protein